MSKSNLSRWITVVNSASRQGLYHDALRLFRQMLSHGLRPHPFVLPGVLRASGHLSDLTTGKILHAISLRSMLHLDAFIGSALIDMYCKCSQVRHARRVFDRIAQRDLVVWNSIISGYAQRGLPVFAMVLSIKMGSSGLQPDLITWNALVSGFSREGDDDMAMDLLRSMQFENIKPDVVSWTSIISGLVLNLKYTKAFLIFKKMVQVARLQPSSVTLSSLLSACANRLDLCRGKEIHGYALVLGVQKDLFVGSALVDMYSKCGHISGASKIFNDLEEKNTVSWNAMIFGYANYGYCQDAIKLYFEMKKGGTKPDHLTFTAVLSACVHAGMAELGRTLFQLMQDEHWIQPRLEHYACMVDLLGRAGQLKEAYDLIEGMPMEPDSFIWGAFLGASRNYGNIGLAELATSRLRKLEPQSAGSCLVLSNMLADAGRQVDAAKMKRTIKRRKLNTLSGSSWMQSA